MEKSEQHPAEGAEGVDTEQDTEKNMEQAVQLLPHAQRDTNFYKVFLDEFTCCIEKIGNKKIKIFCWVVKNIGRNNQFSYTYRQIAAKTNTSYSVVAETMRTLLDIDFFRKEGKILIVNPDIMFKGTYRRRKMVCEQYNKADREGNGIGVHEEMERAKKQLRTLKRNVYAQQKSILTHQRHIIKNQKSIASQKKKIEHLERFINYETEED